MRRPARSLVLLVPALATFLAGCGDSRPGTVVGDAFLAQGLGQEVNLTGLPVRLLEEEAELDSALARLCPTRDGAAAPSRDAAQERAWRERARLLEGVQARKTVTTNAQAQFAMDSVAPGRYRLWADTTIDAVRWTWLQPVEVEAGDTVRVNLTNDNPDENPFRCG